MAWVALAACLWGLWPLWVRGGPGGVAVALVSYVVAFVLAAPLAIVETRRAPRRGAAAWARLLFLGVTDATNAFLYFQALSEGAVAPAVLAHYLAPVVVALLAPRLLGEPRSRRTPLALALALVGTAILVWALPSGGGSAMRAFLFGSGSAVFFAATVLLSKRVSRDFGSAEMLVYHYAAGALYLLPIAWPLGALATLARPALGSVVSSLGAGLVYYIGFRRVPVERVAVLGYLEPLVAVLVGWLAFAETPAASACIGGALILAGGALVITRG